MNTKYQRNTQSQHFNNMNRCEYNKHPRHNNNNTNNYRNSNNGGNNNITNNNIHYDTEKYNIVIGRLQNYMFTEENIRRNNSKNVCVKETSSVKSEPHVKKDQLVKYEPRVKSEQLVKKESVIKEETHVKSEQLVKPISRSERFFVPKQKDSLFWCFYILKNGFLKYEMEPTSFIKEKNEKIKYIDILRDNKKSVKEHKIKPVSDIEDCLANKEFINLKTFITLCILEQMNILIINKHTYIEYIVNQNIDTIHVIHNNDYCKFSIELNKSSTSFIKTDEIVQNYRNTHYQIENIDKPILSISSYKLSELTAICKLLHINYEAENDMVIKKRTKQDIYNMITCALNKIE